MLGFFSHKDEGLTPDFLVLYLQFSEIIVTKYQNVYLGIERLLLHISKNFVQKVFSQLLTTFHLHNRSIKPMQMKWK